MPATFALIDAKISEGVDNVMGNRNRPEINLMLNSAFATVLEPLGGGAEDFFLAASLYHAGKVSFATAASLSGLGYEEFHYRLKEHFGHGIALDDATAAEDLRRGIDLAREIE